MSQLHNALEQCTLLLGAAAYYADEAMTLLDDPLSPAAFLHRDILTAQADSAAIHDLYYEEDTNGDEHAGLAANPEADDAGGTTGVGTDDDEAMREQGANHGA